jgi:hypothetical protein
MKYFALVLLVPYMKYFTRLLYPQYGSLEFFHESLQSDIPHTVNVQSIFVSMPKDHLRVWHSTHLASHSP